MLGRAFQATLLAGILLILGGGSLPLNEHNNQVRRFTRPVEFDYVDWTIDALQIKLQQAAARSSQSLSPTAGSDLVREMVALVEQRRRLEGELGNLLADPAANELTSEIAAKESALDDIRAQLTQLSPLAEAVLQDQLNAIIQEYKLDFAGQALPPVLFHSTPLPWALIVSPRDSIGQQANISLEVEMSLLEQIALEDQVAAELDVATLVVPVGGIGSYPTMIAQSSNLNWLAEVIAHEWIHNYLTLRPLGLLYNRSQDLRTMNETVANIAGKELGAALIARFYPERVPPPPPPAADQPEESLSEPAEPVFDFRAEMHATRIQVDALLEQGRVAEAEAYMEARRLVFWENGYSIRKLNQAYFAFYGSYADRAAGPAGEDPVGDAVRRLWASADSLSAFVNQMAFFTSPEELLAATQSLP